MRPVVTLAALALLMGCANEYSKMPEPTGEWVPANPPNLMAEAAPSKPVRMAGYRRPRPATPLHTAAP